MVEADLEQRLGLHALDVEFDVHAHIEVHELEHLRLQRYMGLEAALRTAEELDVDLNDVKGTGADGRITVKDVREANAE